MLSKLIPVTYEVCCILHCASISSVVSFYITEGYLAESSSIAGNYDH